MKVEIDTRFFRAGVGTVIYNQAGEVVLFERSQYPIGIWQFQQGGIDLNESPEATLWRELREEIGLTKDDFSSVTEMPNWTIYQDTNSVDDVSKSRFGQAHKWYFLELKEDADIDLTRATEDEASDFKWVTFPEAISVTDDLKKHVYRELETYFFEKILKVN
ncbi:NUDIX domain-containing protein [Candidatus Kaiserbacteria bacterium]|nr:NUDIX domain-containing protein [Candidatus Kaiserbacteria bacterium]